MLSCNAWWIHNKMKSLNRFKNRLGTSMKEKSTKGFLTQRYLTIFSNKFTAMPGWCCSGQRYSALCLRTTGWFCCCSSQPGGGMSRIQFFVLYFADSPNWSLVISKFWRWQRLGGGWRSCVPSWRARESSSHVTTAQGKRRPGNKKGVLKKWDGWLN